MKRLKIAVAAFAVLAVVVASFAFTNKSASKPFSVVTKLYNVSSSNVISTTDPNKLILTELNDQSYWGTGSLSHGTGSKLSAIQYDNTEFTFQQAIDGVRSQFNTTSTLPFDMQTFSAPGIGGVSHSITVFRKP